MVFHKEPFVKWGKRGPAGFTKMMLDARHSRQMPTDILALSVLESTIRRPPMSSHDIRTEQRFSTTRCTKISSNPVSPGCSATLRLLLHEYPSQRRNASARRDSRVAKANYNSATGRGAGVTNGAPLTEAPL